MKTLPELQERLRKKRNDLRLAKEADNTEDAAILRVKISELENCERIIMSIMDSVEEFRDATSNGEYDKAHDYAESLLELHGRNPGTDEPDRYQDAKEREDLDP